MPFVNGRERKEKKCLVITKSLNKTKKTISSLFTFVYIHTHRVAHVPFRLHLFFVSRFRRPSIIFSSFFRSCDITADDTFLSLHSTLYRFYSRSLPLLLEGRKIAEKCGGKLLFYSQASNFFKFRTRTTAFFHFLKVIFFALVFVFAPSSCLILSARLCCAVCLLRIAQWQMRNLRRGKRKKEGVNAATHS